MCMFHAVYEAFALSSPEQAMDTFRTVGRQSFLLEAPCEVGHERQPSEEFLERFRSFNWDDAANRNNKKVP